MKLIDAVVPAGDLVKAAKDWIKAGGKPVAPWDVQGFKHAGRAGLFQGRHDDVPAGQRDLPARDLRQLSGRARDPAGGLRRPAIGHGHRAARGVALVRQDPALAGSGRHDPLAVRLHAGAQQRRAAAGQRAGNVAQEDRHRGRRLHGRRHRASERGGRLAGGADRPRPGNRRQRQGGLAQGAHRPRQQRPHEIGRTRRAALADHADARLRRAEGLRPGGRGGVRGPQGEIRRDRQDPGGDRRRTRCFASNTSTLPIYLARRPSSRTRRASSASISSRRSIA